MEAVSGDVDLSTGTRSGQVTKIRPEADEEALPRVTKTEVRNLFDDHFFSSAGGVRP